MPKPFITVNNGKTSIAMFVVILVFFLLQLWLVISLQLFGDEAFYWLESQYLDFSYAELPAWTQWMIRLGTTLFGQNKFAVRSFSYLGYCSVFYALWLINKKLSISSSDRFSNIMLMFSMPIFVLIAVMAMPDIWLIFFIMWISYFVIVACNNNETKYWVIIGLFIACGLNVHVRMWIWVFFAGIAFVILHINQKQLIKSLLLISLPLSLVGLIPVILFNYQHDFVLFDFQFEQRHPWNFQLKNISFLLSQLIVITPVVLYLWFKSVSTIFTKQKTLQSVKWIAWTAVAHWLFYVFSSLFADGLRTTVHWVIVSYVPLLAITTLVINSQRLIHGAVVTGHMISLSLLFFLSVPIEENSNLQARILDNSVGWKQLSQQVKIIQQQNEVDNIIADYFMTAAELAFELDIDLSKQDSLKVLPHPKNRKHGREKQLEIMGLLLRDTQSYQENALLVIEDSTLKLQDKGKYYQNICQSFKQIQYLKTINIEGANKQFHVYLINKLNHDENEPCKIPPLFYIDHKKINNGYEISGWVIFHQYGIQSLTLRTEGEDIMIPLYNLPNKGIAAKFPEIDDPNLPFNAFKIQIESSIVTNKQLQILAKGNDQKKYLSKQYFID